MNLATFKISYFQLAELAKIGADECVGYNNVYPPIHLINHELSLLWYSRMTGFSITNPTEIHTQNIYIYMPYIKITKKPYAQTNCFLKLPLWPKTQISVKFESLAFGVNKIPDVNTRRCMKSMDSQSVWNEARSCAKTAAVMPHWDPNCRRFPPVSDSSQWAKKIKQSF